MSWSRLDFLKRFKLRLEFVAATSVALALCGGLLAIEAYLPDAMKAAAIEAAYRSNIETVDQIKLTRGYYTRNVVAKELASGHLIPSHDHKNNPKAIPLPATFVQDISDLLKAKETTLLTAATTANHRSPGDCRTAEKRENFPMKPMNGGTPVRDSMKNIVVSASGRERWARPLKPSMDSVFDSCPIAKTLAKAPKFMNT